MRPLFTLVYTVLLPLSVVAQSYSNAPLVVIGEGAAAKPAPTASAAAAPATGSIAGFPNFPEIAITRVGEKSNTEHVDPPANPPSPSAPAAAASGASTPATPANPASPIAPKSPVSKLWPRDTVQIFVPPCTGLRPQFVIPCTCVITKLMVAMPHDEFLAKSEAGTIEQDPRLQRIRQDCAAAPQKKE